MDKEEFITGAGERVAGMNRRGNRFRLYNKPSYGYETQADLMYYSLPLAVSDKKYMLLFDNGADGYMDIGATDPDILKFETSGGRLAYVLVADTDWQGLIQKYTEVTGRQPLPPLWTLGNIASRMGYHSQRELEELVRMYQRDSIPLDAVVLDVYWFGKELQGTLGNLEWYRDSFPQAEKMMRDFLSQGIKTVLITEPFIIRNTLKYEETVQKGLLAKNAQGQPYMYDFYFGNTGLLDIFNPDTRSWFWDIYRRHTKTGVAGWWGDLGEPEVHPDDIIHYIGRGKYVHNLYGHEWARLIHEGYRKDFPDQRPVILMRSGFAGSQRYGMLPWSGDVSRTWGGLKPQVEIALSMGLQGLGYMHSDLGGFAGAYKDAGLYTRWLQYGAFQPVYRTHGQSEVPSEPVFWDEATKEIVRNFIKVRYLFLPYNYTLAWQNSTKGLPMMRPLFYLDDQRKHYENTTTYLWGNDILVRPVVEKEIKVQKVDFPAGHYWYHPISDKHYMGGTSAEIPVTAERIPIFRRAGAIIPQTSPIDNTTKYDTSKIYFNYFHHPSVTRDYSEFYEDDGKTPGTFEDGRYLLHQFYVSNTKNRITIRYSRKGKGFSGQKGADQYFFDLNNIPKSFRKIHYKDRTGKKVSIDVPRLNDETYNFRIPYYFGDIILTEN